MCDEVLQIKEATARLDLLIAVRKFAARLDKLCGNREKADA